MPQFGKLKKAKLTQTFVSLQCKRKGPEKSQKLFVFITQQLRQGMHKFLRHLNFFTLFQSFLFCISEVYVRLPHVSGEIMYLG